MTDYSLAAESVDPDDLAMIPVANAARAVIGLRPGGRVVGMTKGQFSMIDLIRAVLDITGPAHLQLSTWTAGIRDTKNAGFLFTDGRLLSVRWLVDRSFATRQPAYCAALVRIFGKEAIRCTRTHAKVALIKNDDWSISIRSSMNLNKNPRFENFDIDDNGPIFDLFAAHFADMETSMAEGPSVPTSEVDAVFERAARGVNPFTPIDAAWADAELGDESLLSFVRSALRENSRNGAGTRTNKTLAGRVGISERELRAMLRRDDIPRSLVHDIVAAVR